MDELCEVIITAPDPDWLLDFTRQLVADHLASAAHNYTPVRSVYRWKGEVHDRSEGRVSLHTRRTLVPEIVRRTNEQHPYEVPSVSTRPINDGNPSYLQSLLDETKHPDMNEPSKQEQIRAEQRKIETYSQIAQERREAGDLAGVSDANKALGEAVTAIHRISEIGVCATCGAIEQTEWLGVGDERDFWHCHTCGHRWSTPHGLKPTEVQ